MNEAEIIQQHLDVERRHFAQVAQACASALRARGAAGEPVLGACLDYFEFALARLRSPAAAEARTLLNAARTADAAVSATPWEAFLRLFHTACSDHFAAIDALRTRNESVTRWRALSGLDADVIVAERERFSNVQARLSSLP